MHDHAMNVPWMVNDGCLVVPSHLCLFSMTFHSICSGGEDSLQDDMISSSNKMPYLAEISIFYI